MCAETGRPYYLSYDTQTRTWTKEYTLPDVQIPLHLQKYLVGRGHLFHAYTEHFNLQEIYKTDVGSFLEHFPSWDEVIQNDFYSDDYEDCWNEEDHANFKDLLEFLTNQDVTYTVVWSY